MTTLAEYYREIARETIGALGVLFGVLVLMAFAGVLAGCRWAGEQTYYWMRRKKING